VDERDPVCLALTRVVGKARDDGTMNVGALRLAPDFSFAELPDGERVVFTRSETRVLSALAQHPNRLLSREQMLDAVSEPGSDKRDRNIDFLVNRLRRKLSDDARSPRYIATRYGEGYVWIGQQTTINPLHSGVYFVVGPVRGMGNLGELHSRADQFTSALLSALRDELPASRVVILAPDCPPASEFVGDLPEMAVELNYFEETGTGHCVATMRHFRSGRILAIKRLILPGDDRRNAANVAAEVTGWLLNNAWREKAGQIEPGVPLPVLMQLASTEPDYGYGSENDSDRRLRKLSDLHQARTMAAIKENEARVRALLKADPDDPILKIMCATQIHMKYVVQGHNLFRAGIDNRTADEDEIEALVQSALPYVQVKSDYVIMAAKLLHFLDRGYSELAYDLSEQAYSSTVSAAGSLAIVAQMRAFAGNSEAALRCIDQALNLIEPGSKAHLYTLTIKMQALRAIEDFDRLREAKREFLSIARVASFFYEPLFCEPNAPSLRARAMMLLISRDQASGMLLHTNYISARLFRDADHRANSILSPLSLAVRRYGADFVPAEIWQSHPGLAARFGARPPSGAAVVPEGVFQTVSK
jgi:hypothetical protein